MEDYFIVFNGSNISSEAPLLVPKGELMRVIKSLKQRHDKGADFVFHRVGAAVYPRIGKVQETKVVDVETLEFE